MTDRPKITIDGVDYVVEDLPQAALDQLSSMMAVDRKIATVQEELAFLQTARNAYAAALSAALPKNAQ